jgi:hypothetical protein
VLIRESAGLLDEAHEGAAGAVFEHQIAPIVGFGIIVKIDNVGVVEVTEDWHFLDANGEAGTEGDLLERKVGILPAGAFDEADVGGTAGPAFLDDLGLFGREEGEKGGQGGAKMRMGEAGERIEWKRGEGVGYVWGRKRRELGKKIEGRKAELRKRR